VNDQHDHAIEDLVLIKTTELIKANSREIDLLARCGGKAVVLREEMGKLGVFYKHYYDIGKSVLYCVA